MLKTFLKRIVILSVILLSVGVGARVEAAGIPHAFWNLSSQYDQAVSSNNHERIISTSRDIVNLFGNRVDNQALDIVTPRLEKKALSYEALGRYDDAIRVWQRYIPYARRKGWDDGVKHAESKISALRLDLDLYVQTDDLSGNRYLGQKFEPRSGVIFGTFYDQDSRLSGMFPSNYSWDRIKNYYPNKSSSYFIYKQWGEAVKDLDGSFEDAKRNNMAVQLALNFDQEPDGAIRNVSSQRAYVVEIAKYLNEKNVPVFLRFANEMNVDPKLMNYPEEYKQAFRFVSTIMKEHAPNVAMVWAPNDISAAGKNYDMYYPGDGYVDWVGLSTYHNYYFQGRDGHGDDINSIYFTGDYANPVEKIRDFVEKYGSRKPIMLAESGIGHYSRTMGRDLTSPWAAVQMRRMYDYVPMVYPEVKAIFYFNRNQEGENQDYALHSNSNMNMLYNELVGRDNYVRDINTNASMRYKKVDGQVVIDRPTTFSTYTIPPKELQPKVEYRLNGNLIKTSTVVPYNVEISPSSLSAGANTLNVRVIDGSGRLLKSRDYTISGQTKENLSLNQSSSWARDEISSANQIGLVPGKVLGNYRSNISRAEFSAMMVRLYEKMSGESVQAPTKNPFVDTDSEDVLKAYKLGITSGVSSSRFNPNSHITREQIATMMYRVIEAVDSNNTHGVEHVRFSDHAEISNWAMDSVQFVNNKDIMRGVGGNRIDPKANTSREQAIALTLRTYNRFK